MDIYQSQLSESGDGIQSRPMILRPSTRYYYRLPDRYAHHLRDATISGLGETLGCVDLKNSPPGYTIYCPIDLGIGLAPTRSGGIPCVHPISGKGGFSCVHPITGIFVPQNYKMKSDVDLIVYLHGFKDAFPGNEASIVNYWDGKKFPFFALREGVNDSGKNVVLVAPTLGPKSQAGSLVNPGGFDAFLDEVVAALNQHVPFSTSTSGKIANIANIILACHSGGGAPMLQIATGSDKQVAKVKQCWGFDSLNSGKTQTGQKLFTQPDAWLKWAQRTTSELCIFFKDSTQAESVYLDKKVKSGRVTNIHVTQSSATSTRTPKADAHFWVPLVHWKASIQNATFLSNR
jgi:hypothetical protein